MFPYAISFICTLCSEMDKLRDETEQQVEECVARFAAESKVTNANITAVTNRFEGIQSKIDGKFTAFANQVSRCAAYQIIQNFNSWEYLLPADTSYALSTTRTHSYVRSVTLSDVWRRVSRR